MLAFRASLRAFLLNESSVPSVLGLVAHRRASSRVLEGESQ